jgi:pyruvate formate lyase activating enzyme
VKTSGLFTWGEGFLTKEITGRIYDIQKFSVHDGPGIRTTVFLKGCPLRCPWCHSPESQAFGKELCWMEMRCVGIDKCGLCLDQCPQGAIAPGKRHYSEVNKEETQLISVDRSKCDHCGLCEKVCFAKALYLCGTDYTVEEVLKIILDDDTFYKTSGGGVTISGGEALNQPEFTTAFLKACRKQGVNTALDTTGYADYKIIRELLPYVDLFLYDIKHMNSEIHKKLVGVPNERILENAENIAHDGGRLQIRMPIITGVNDSEEEIHAAGLFCKTLGKAVTLVQLLPYHRLGSVKYKRLQKADPMPQCDPPDETLIDRCVKHLEGLRLNVTVH